MARNDKQTQAYRPKEEYRKLNIIRVFRHNISRGGGMYQIEVMYPIMLLLVVGIVISYICHKLKMPTAIFLLLAGIIIGKLSLPQFFTEVPRTFVLGVSIFGFIMVTYDVFSRLKPHRHDTYQNNAVQITAVFIGITLLTLGAVFISAPLTEDPIMAMLICSLIAGISIPFYTLKSARLKHFLDIEVNFNEAVILFIAGLLIHFAAFRLENPITANLFGYMVSFTMQILVGIGAGILFGIVVFRLFRKVSKKLSPIALLAVCVAAYTFAELAGGAGIFAVLSMALLYGGMTIHHKQELEEFSTTLSQGVEIMVFLLMGLVISIPASGAFLLMSLIVFICLVAARFFSVSVILRDQFFSLKERLILSVIAPKGVVVAVVGLAAFFLGKEALPLLQILVAVILYSQIASWLGHAIRT
jgi:cell volume regulation protein A